MWGKKKRKLSYKYRQSQKRFIMGARPVGDVRGDLHCSYLLAEPECKGRQEDQMRSAMGGQRDSVQRAKTQEGTARLFVKSL